MCGRYVIISTPEAIRALFGYGEQPNFPPRYNVAPTQPIPVVRLDDGKRSFALMRWGLLPSWVKDPKTFPLLINARGESVLEKPAFRNAMRRRRCLIPTDGFYEWQASGTTGPPKRPYFVRAKRGADGSAPPLAFAGLYETWTGPNGEELDTAAIITTTANRTLSAVHERMPVFVAAGSVRPVARLRQCRSRRRRSLDRAGRRGAARSLRGLDRGEPRRQRFRGAHRAGSSRCRASGREPTRRQEKREKSKTAKTIRRSGLVVLAA